MGENLAALETSVGCRPGSVSLCRRVNTACLQTQNDRWKKSRLKNTVQFIYVLAFLRAYHVVWVSCDTQIKAWLW